MILLTEYGTIWALWLLASFKHLYFKLDTNLIATPTLIIIAKLAEYFC